MRPHLVNANCEYPPDSLVSIVGEKCHVRLFGNIDDHLTRVWVNIKDTVSFIGNESLKNRKFTFENDITKENFSIALSEAKKASKMTLIDRREKYCFLEKNKKKKKNLSRNKKMDAISDTNSLIPWAAVSLPRGRR